MADSSFLCPYRQRLWHIDADQSQGGVHFIIAADEGPCPQKGRAARHSAVATCRTARASLMGPSQLNAVFGGQSGLDEGSRPRRLWAEGDVCAALTRSSRRRQSLSLESRRWRCRSRSV